MSMWVPNSEWVHKNWWLEGENEIPHIPFFDFLTILAFLEGCETNFTKQKSLNSKNPCGFIIPTLKVRVTNPQGFFDLNNFLLSKADFAVVEAAKSALLNKICSNQKILADLLLKLLKLE